MRRNSSLYKNGALIGMVENASCVLNSHKRRHECSKTCERLPRRKRNHLLDKSGQAPRGGTSGGLAAHALRGLSAASAPIAWNSHADRRILEKAGLIHEELDAM